MLVPVGGGKDSAVTLELLKGAGVPVYAYIINSRGATIHTTEAAGLDEDHVIYVKRTLEMCIRDSLCFLCTPFPDKFFPGFRHQIAAVKISGKLIFLCLIPLIQACFFIMFK